MITTANPIAAMDVSQRPKRRVRKNQERKTPANRMYSSRSPGRVSAWRIFEAAKNISIL
jgi:hypothetical protein